MLLLFLTFTWICLGFPKIYFIEQLYSLKNKFHNKDLEICHAVSMLENQRASSPINCTEQPCNLIFYGLILFNPGLNCLAQKLKKKRTVPTVLWSQITWMVHYRRKKNVYLFQSHSQASWQSFILRTTMWRKTPATVSPVATAEWTPRRPMSENNSQMKASQSEQLLC